MRILFVKQSWFLLAVSTLLMAGCAGGDNGGGYYTPGFGSVSGVVYDQSGKAVRNAQVSYIDNFIGEVDTLTNTKGAYILRGIPASVDLIQCKLVSNGINYYGENVAALNPGQRTMTINIGLFPSTQLGSLTGTITDSFGNLLAGASIYAIPTNGSTMSSAYGITDNTGTYTIGGLLAGATYKIQANALGYGSATDSETLTAGQAKSVNYTLPPTTTTTLAAPSGVAAIAYTAPGYASTQPQLRSALDAVKSIIDPRRKLLHPALKTNKKKISPFDTANPIEIDVTWAPNNNVSLLGYGIYRSNSAATPQNVDFLSDPLASVYEDMSGSLTSGTTYTYAVTTVSTSVNNKQGESPLSTTASATPLGPLVPGAVAASAQPTFTWQPATGAATYAVFVFNQYPTIGISDIWDNKNSQTSGSSLSYSGPALTSGQTYFYIVVGFDAAGDETLSPVEQFSVP